MTEESLRFMLTAPSLAFFAIGLAIGSFLNVCSFRLPRGESVVWPGSRCPRCERRLSWSETLPIVGYLWLRGRCRTCGNVIGMTYPLVEVATGCLFVFHYLQFSWQPLLLVRLLFCCAMVVLFVTDLRDRLLPNMVTLPGIGIGLAASVFLDAEPSWRSAVVGAAVGGGGLFVLAEAYYYVRKEDGLGRGDVKMLAMIGAFLGWQHTFLTLMLASIGGSVVGVVMLALRLGGRRYALPFGSFLAIAAIIMSTGGDVLVDWYFRTLLP